MRACAADVHAAFVIHNPGFGGGYNELLRQRQGLEAAGWRLTLVTCAGPNTGADRLAAAGVEVVRMPLHRLRAPRRVRAHAALLAGFGPEVAALRRLIRRHGIDLVQVHGEANFHAAVAGRLEQIAVCWHLYDLNAPRAIRRLTTPALVRLAGAATIVGEATAREYPGLERLGERLVVTFPPVDGHVFRPDGGVRAAARAELGVGEGEIVVGTVGARNPAKGHDLLVEVAGRLLPAHADVRVLILGEASPGHPEHELALQRAIATLAVGDRVRMIDPGTRVAELMPAFDLFVLPSIREAMPTVVLEAMACALPVVATDVGSVREEVVDGETGFVVPARDPGALVTALERLLATPDLARRFGAAGRDRVTRLFTPERAVANRLRAWELAAAAARRDLR